MSISSLLLSLLLLLLCVHTTLASVAPVSDSSSDSDSVSESESESESGSSSDSDSATSTDLTAMVQEICDQEDFSEAQCEVLLNGVEIAVAANLPSMQLMEIVLELISGLANGFLLASDNDDACNPNAGILTGSQEFDSSFLVVNNVNMVSPPNEVDSDSVVPLVGDPIDSSVFFAMNRISTTALSPDGEQLFVLVNAMGGGQLLLEADVEDILAKAQDDTQELNLNQLGTMPNTLQWTHMTTNCDGGLLAVATNGNIYAIDTENPDPTTGVFPTTFVGVFPNNENAPFTLNPATGQFTTVLASGAVWSFALECTAPTGTVISNELSAIENVCDGRVTAIAFIESDNAEQGDLYQILCDDTTGGEDSAFAIMSIETSSSVPAVAFPARSIEAITEPIGGVIQVNTDLSDGCQTDAFTNQDLCTATDELTTCVV